MPVPNLFRAQSLSLSLYINNLSWSAIHGTQKEKGGLVTEPPISSHTLTGELLLLIHTNVHVYGECGPVQKCMYLLN